MSGTTRITVGIIAVVVVLAIAGYWYFSKADAPSVDETPAPTQAEPVAATPTADQQIDERLRDATLEGSDIVVRDVVAALSARPELVSWLANEDLVRRFVAAVNNVADGVSPRAHLEFLKPKGVFQVLEDGETLVVDPKSWRRYDTATEVFVSIDSAGAGQLFVELEPLINEAHREIAPPGTSFRTTLAAAIDRMLSVPVLDGDEILTPKVVTFAYEDESLEGLSGAQRQLLRMGPENVAKIQAKLRELKRTLGL